MLASLVLAGGTSENEARQVQFEDETPGFPCQFYVGDFFYDLSRLAKVNEDYKAPCQTESMCTNA